MEPVVRQAPRPISLSEALNQKPQIFGAAGSSHSQQASRRSFVSRQNQRSFPPRPVVNYQEAKKVEEDETIRL